MASTALLQGPHGRWRKRPRMALAAGDNVRSERPSTSTSVPKLSSHPRILGCPKCSCTSFWHPQVEHSPRAPEGIYSIDHLPRGGDLWVPGPPPLTSALPRSFDGLLEAPREARWKTEPLRVRDAAGSQGFKSVLLSAYDLTSPLLSHSISTTKQEED